MTPRGSPRETATTGDLAHPSRAQQAEDLVGT
jgi:hypothetical protein